MPVDRRRGLTRVNAVRSGRDYQGTFIGREDFDVIRLDAMFAVALLAISSAEAGGLLSEQQARAKAIKILQGDPYGNTPAEVAKSIKQIDFLQDGNTKACGAKKRPAFELHIVVVTANKDQFSKGVIDGFLALDAQTGKLLCANLPMLN